MSPPLFIANCLSGMGKVRFVWLGAFRSGKRLGLHSGKTSEVRQLWLVSMIQALQWHSLLAPDDSPMPYEIAFSKKLPPLYHTDYINECCVGGDVVASSFLPALAARYGEQEPGEEDWGWFIWFDHAGVRLAIDIFCDDPETGSYRTHLTSSTRGWLRQAVRDTPELEVLRETVVAALSEWLGYVADVRALDKNYHPIS